MKLSDAERQHNTNEKLASRVSRFQTRLREGLEVYEFSELSDEKLFPREGLRAALTQHQDTQPAGGHDLDRSETVSDCQTAHRVPRGHEVLLWSVRKSIPRLRSDSRTVAG